MAYKLYYLFPSNIDVKTLRNWRKHKPELYKKVIQGFQLEAAVQEAKEHYERLKNIANEGLTITTLDKKASTD